MGCKSAKPSINPAHLHTFQVQATARRPSQSEVVDRMLDLNVKLATKVLAYFGGILLKNLNFTIFLFVQICVLALRQQHLKIKGVAFKVIKFTRTCT